MYLATPIPYFFKKLPSCRTTLEPESASVLPKYYPKTMEEVPPLFGSDLPLVELGPPLVGLDCSQIAILIYIQKEDMKISITDF